MKSVDQSRMMDRYGTPSRPDDIPEAVWHSCWWAQAYGLQEAASRQIMAAKAEEREANEAACLERAETHKAAVAQYPDDEQSRILCLDSALEAMECAAAIRKRGEAD